MMGRCIPNMAKKTYQDIAEIRKTLDVFMPDNKLIEIREISGKYPQSGYFSGN